MYRYGKSKERRQIIRTSIMNNHSTAEMKNLRSFYMTNRMIASNSNYPKAANSLIKFDWQKTRYNAILFINKMFRVR